jgi:nicotinate-nucleotide pyrophosphorylase (carboxylating)
MSAPSSELSPLSPVLIEPAVRAALAEDLGTGGDLTTDNVVPETARAEVAVVPRKPGRVAGLDLAATAFRLVDPAIRFETLVRDGGDAVPGEPIALVTGPGRGVLTGERVALNFLGHLSGIATATNGIVKAIAGTRARVCCTRKTTPGLRVFEKYAVRAGGGVNHRFGLHDGVLIKDNHIAVAGGIRATIAAARGRVGHMVKIEVEVDTLDQLEEALAAGADAVLLDNMSPETLARAVKMVAGRAVTEASGNINLETAPAIAASGVDLLSVGWITHSAPCLDIGLDFRSLVA